MRFIFLVTFVLANLSCVQSEEPDITTAISAKLLLPKKKVIAGEEIDLGIEFKIREGWHIYWKNPGESGLPTRVSFEESAGAKFEELRYPIPLKFSQAGDLVGYGYENEVVMLSSAGIDQDLARGTQIQIRAKVRWLGCSDVCVPGKAELVETLEVVSEKAADSDLKASETLQRWKKDYMPEPVELHGQPELTDKIVTEQAEGRLYQLVFSWKEVPDTVQWFPPAEQGVAFKDISTTHVEGKTTLRFLVRPSEAGNFPSHTMQSLFVVLDAGKRSGIPFGLNF